MHGIDLLHMHIFFLYSQLISKIDIFWSNVDDFTVFLMLQNSSDFEICSLMWDNDKMLNNKFISVYRSSCICRILTQTYCKILLSMCVAMCMCILCNIYVALGARGLKIVFKIENLCLICGYLCYCIYYTILMKIAHFDVSTNSYIAEVA